jgi:hypothetical protein
VPRFSQELNGTALLHRGPNAYLESSFILTFFLQTTTFSKWAMLGSNQRPLPCEGRILLSAGFAVVQKHVQNGIFFVQPSRGCSPRFMWVGVLLV